MKLNFLCVEKKTKITLLAIILLATLFVLGGAQINALPQRCILCHSMKPEYYTWMASPHGRAKVSCISCHSPPGIKGFFAAKGQGFKELYSTVTQSFVAPIRMKGVISDGVCERCHNIRGLSQESYGDIKISHINHKGYAVRCVKCHSGLAHGNIAERKVTYVSDYPKWEPALGQTFMADKTYSNPDMDVCFRCHKLRSAPTTCTTCHKKSKVPTGHRSAGFREGGHGLAARPNIKACDNCHKYSSDKQVDGFEEVQKFEEFLGDKSSKHIVTAEYYSRVNTFCKNCHSKRPKSHDPKYLSSHGTLAQKSKSGCMTCHNNQKHRPDAAALGSSHSLTDIVSGSKTPEDTAKSDNKPPSAVACASCHPSMHVESNDWRSTHPVPVTEKPRITRYCYYCHMESQCSACHGKVKSIKITKEE